MLRLGIDIGGTFTDFALVDANRRRTAVHKRLTTPADPARAVLEGVGAITRENGINVADLTEIVHGTTLVTNALIERRGARLGMLVTRGFRDIFDIGAEQRYDMYDLRLQFAEPLVDRSARVEISERMRHDGSVLTPLDEEEVANAVDELVAAHGVNAIAICYLHSYANADHEERTRQIVSGRHPDLFVSTSSGVFPYARELERWTTTCANAYAQPMVDAYLARLETGLGDAGFSGHLAIISSSGGLMTPQTARLYPVRLLESGPAAGVLMAARIGREFKFDSLLSFDLGGTTAKGALVRKGKPYKKYTFEAAHAYKYKSGSGLQLQIPVIDMSEIGAGGGSIVSIDELGRLRVGPVSACADPGPVSYSKGGTEPTLTDANLTLGYLDPDFFLGGAMKLDAAAAGAVIQTLAKNVDLELVRAAWGIHNIANEDISRAFRMHATERGFDYRRSGMAAFGGGGPIHAARIARKLRVPRLVFPAGAGVMSAFGMLAGAASFEIMHSAQRKLAALDAAGLEAAFEPIEAEATAYLLASDVAREDIRLERRLDMRYSGQGYDIEVTLPSGKSFENMLAQLPELFADAYRSIFDTTLDQPLEIVSLKVEAIGPEPDFPEVTGYTGSAAAGTDALKGYRRAYFPAAGGMIDCPVYDRYALGPDVTIEGPCLIEERESTVLLDVGDRGRTDVHGNIIASIDLSRQPVGEA